MRFCFLLCTVGTRVPALRTCDSTDPAPWCGNNINPWILHHIGVALPRRPPPCVRKCEFFWCFFWCFFVFFLVFFGCVFVPFFLAPSQRQPLAAAGRRRLELDGLAQLKDAVHRKRVQRHELEHAPHLLQKKKKTKTR